MTATTDTIEAEINRSRTALNDTIEQLGNKLSPGQIIDEALGLFQGEAGKFTANIGKQVRDNPLPVLLVGARLAMLFTQKKDSHHAASVGHDDWREETRYRSLESARSSLSRGADETEDMWAHRVHEVEVKALEMQQHAGEAVDAFKARVKSAGDTLAKTATGIRERMASGMSHAAHAVSSGADRAAHFAGDQAHNLKMAAGNAKHWTQDFYKDYPLAAGAIGVAIGALIGATAPLSSLERDELQGVADAASKAGAGMADKGARAVERAAEKAAAALH